MSHDFHEALPGFDPRQILHDGCSECEARGANIVTALASMDPITFSRAWERAEEWQAGGWHGNLNLSNAEALLLRVLWGVRLGLRNAREAGIAS